MKLSNQTIEILQYCAKLNEGLVLRPGQLIRTITKNKALFAEFQVEEQFPVECALILKPFLHNLDSDTNVSFDHQEYILLSKSRTKTKVPRLDPKMVTAPPNKSLKVDQFEEKAFLHVDDLEEMPLGNLNSTFVFYAEVAGAPIGLDICQNDVVRTLELKIPRKANQAFRATIKGKNLVLPDGSYEVEFSRKGVSRWRGLNVAATIFVAIESRASSFVEKPNEPTQNVGTA